MYDGGFSVFTFFREIKLKGKLEMQFEFDELGNDLQNGVVEDKVDGC